MSIKPENVEAVVVSNAASNMIKTKTILEERSVIDDNID